MRRHHPRRIAGLAAAALALAGCGEDPGIEEGVVPPRGTDTSSLAPLRDDMIKNMQDRSYLKKSGGEGESAATSGGAAGSKPPAGSGSAAGSGNGSSPGMASKGG